MRTHVNSGRVLRNISLRINIKRAYTVVNPGNSNGSALDTILANGPLCRIARNRIAFHKGGLLAVTPRRETRRNLFLSFRCPIRVPKIDVAGFLHTTIGRGQGCRNLPPVGIDSFVGLVHRGHRIIRLSGYLAGHSIGRKFSKKRGGHGRVFRVTVLSPHLTVLSRASSKLSMSTVHVITRKIGALLAPSASYVIVARCSHLLRVVHPRHMRVLCGKHVIHSNKTRLTARVRGGNCS